MNTPQDFSINRWLRSPSGPIFLIFLVIVAFYLISEHTAHVFGLLPFTLLLCPLMMLFMHGDHAGHSPQSQRDSQSDSPRHPRDSGSDNPPGHVH